MLLQREEAKKNGECRAMHEHGDNKLKRSVRMLESLQEATDPEKCGTARQLLHTALGASCLAVPHFLAGLWHR
jgi:hypothetical protein